MNILFHTATAVGIIAVLADSREEVASKTNEYSKAAVAFVIGVISHGALDYIPHCYPINSRVDVIAGAIIMTMLTFLSKPNYRWMVGLAFIGCIFPDLIDLSPEILNKFFGLSIPVYENIFPWHWEKYSGSIFIDDCMVSNFNHLLVVIVVVLICLNRKDDLRKIFKYKRDVLL